MWQYLVEHAKDYGFLGPIVGIAGLLLGAGGALLLGWTKALKDFKPPGDVLDAGLDKVVFRVVTLLCAVGLFVAWFLAEPSNGRDYLLAALWLAVALIVFLLVYVGLRASCGRFRQPLINLATNQQEGKRVVWGGLWLTPRARKAKKRGTTVKDFLAGNGYDREQVWSGPSQTASAVLTVFTLLGLLVCGTSALATASTAAQVALTRKPARQVFGTEEVPGLPPGKGAEPNNSPSR